MQRNASMSYLQALPVGGRQAEAWEEEEEEEGGGDQVYGWLEGESEWSWARRPTDARGFSSAGLTHYTHHQF